MLAASIVASSFERVRSCVSSSSVPVYFAKRPRTFETTRCRIEKLMPECAASMFHLFVVMFVLRAPERTTVLLNELDRLLWKDCST